ncbi:unknown [Firmicutes bacterium CAG:24]|nr:unknown [Firmicutes bacterium CAG:24]
MVTLANGGAWLVNGAEIIADGPKANLLTKRYE